MDERAYAVAFLTIEGVGAIRLRRLRDRFGSLAEAWRAPASSLCEVPGIGPEIAQAIVAQRPGCDPDQEIRRLAEAKVTMVGSWEPDFPPSLSEIYDPPAVLFVKGRMPDFRRSVAIVGTRACTSYGARVAQRLARELAAAGVVVVSGLAAGIDAIAHQGAMETGLTVAVLGSAVDRVYPSINRGLAHRIAEQGGALLSEYPLGTEPAAGQFPARNRIVSGLCQAVVVVEAKERSGALITAEMALDQNREVMAVPGPVEAPNSAGPHRLIQQGAKLVTCAADILDELGWGTCEPPRRAEPTGLTAEEAKVYAAIALDPTPLTRIGQATGLSPQVVNTTLLVLELKALVSQLPGRLYVRR